MQLVILDRDGVINQDSDNYIKSPEEYIPLPGSLAAIASQGVQDQGLLMALIAVISLTGIFQFLLGISGGGQLIKFIPYPAVAGLVSGIGVLMVLSQLESLSGKGGQELGSGWFAVPAVTALATFVSIKLVPRILPAIPATISGLVVGVAAFSAQEADQMPAAPDTNQVHGHFPPGDRLQRLAQGQRFPGVLD